MATGPGNPGDQVITLEGLGMPNNLWPEHEWEEYRLPPAKDPSVRLTPIDGKNRRAY